MWSVAEMVNADTEKHSTCFVESKSIEENDNKEIV